MEKQDEKYLMEVKGCTLEIDGIGYFPDAPSERAVRHLHELMHAAKQGYHCILAFVIAMPGGDGCASEYDNASRIWSGFI